MVADLKQLIIFPLIIFLAREAVRKELFLLLLVHFGKACQYSELGMLNIRKRNRAKIRERLYKEEKMR